MRNVIERVHHLIALASSTNDNEARNAAMLAVQLIRKHRLVLSLPASGSGSVARTRTKNDPGGAPQAPQSSRSGRSRSSKNNRRVADPPERIVAPLGGECLHCGGRYRAEASVYWFASGGAMHPKCFAEWWAR